LTVASIAAWFELDVTLPEGASTTIGIDPLAWLGSSRSSRFVARVESEPGIVVSSLVGRPAALASRTIATVNTSQAPTTIRGWRVTR